MPKDAKTTFKNLFEAGSKAFKLIRQSAISPESHKKLKKEWNISEAADMVGRTPQTLRNLEESGKINKARILEKSKRVYDLQEINFLRNYFGTKPSKPKGAETAILGFANFKGGAGKTISSVSAA